MNETDNSAEPETTGAKQSPTRFQPGQSGNPKGRPPGSRNKTTMAVEGLLDGDAEAITRKAIEKAKGGDATMIRLCARGCKIQRRLASRVSGADEYPALKRCINRPQQDSLPIPPLPKTQSLLTVPHLV